MPRVLPSFLPDLSALRAPGENKPIYTDQAIIAKRDEFSRTLTRAGCPRQGRPRPVALVCGLYARIRFRMPVGVHPRAPTSKTMVVAVLVTRDTTYRSRITGETDAARRLHEVASTFLVSWFLGRGEGRGPRSQRQALLSLWWFSATGVSSSPSAVDVVVVHLDRGPVRLAGCLRASHLVLGAECHGRDGEVHPRLDQPQSQTEKG